MTTTLWRRTGIATVALATLGLWLPLSVAAGASATPVANDPAGYVNPFIGTALADDDFPAADAPFGMMQWGPQTAPDPPSGGGYGYHEPDITGFGLTHVSGPGCNAGNDIPMLPTTGAIEVHDGSVMPEEPFTHTGESASPGYYRVDVGSPAVRTELTVTPRTGLARLTFPSTSQANVLINLGGSQLQVRTAHATIIGDDEIEGSATVGGNGNGFCSSNEEYTIYFWTQFARPFATFGTWSGTSIQPGSRNAAGYNSGLYVTFSALTDPTVLEKTAISYVSDANAQDNARVEDPGWNFDATQAATTASWNNLLNRVQVAGGTTSDLTVFYTSLYHSLLHPNLFSDDNGQYMGVDGKVHTVPLGHGDYTNYSGWDVYRSQIQLLTLIDPAVASDIATSVLADDTQSGALPKWMLNNGESYIMVGDSTDPILADLHAFGATFNTTAALDDMVKQAMKPSDIRPGLTYYESMHYLPINGTYSCCNYYGPVSTAIEYETDDQSIAQLAAAVGDNSLATQFLTRAQNWEYLFNPATGFIEPKALNGEFPYLFFPENPAAYVEANAFEYSTDVPFNLKGLITAGGGDTKFVDYLNALFADFIGPDAPLAQPLDYALQPDGIKIAYASPFSWQGNEPALEIPYEYDYAGDPAQAANVVRQITQSLYTNTPDGIPGNDDLGEMSSWLVFADLGFYPETPGNATLALGSPLFTHERIALGNGHAIVINAPGASAANRYVQAASVNGHPWNSAFLPPSTVSSGADVNFVVGSNPSSWASAPNAAPPSWTSGEMPAIGFASTQSVASSTLGSSFDLGAQDVSGAGEVVQWHMQASPGITLRSTSGTLDVPAGGRIEHPLTITTASNSTTGTITITMRTATGQLLAPVVVAVSPEAAALIGGIEGLDISGDAGI